ncbi:hypothetical protein IWX92DRAFT_361356, partial [Phyllosticta citricarpa]
MADVFRANFLFFLDTAWASVVWGYIWELRGFRVKAGTSARNLQSPPHPTSSAHRPRRAWQAGNTSKLCGGRASYLRATGQIRREREAVNGASSQSAVQRVMC